MKDKIYCYASAIYGLTRDDLLATQNRGSKQTNKLFQLSQHENEEDIIQFLDFSAWDILGLMHINDVTTFLFLYNPNLDSVINHSELSEVTSPEDVSDLIGWGFLISYNDLYSPLLKIYSVYSDRLSHLQANLMNTDAVIEIKLLKGELHSKNLELIKEWQVVLDNSYFYSYTARAKIIAKHLKILKEFSIELRDEVLPNMLIKNGMSLFGESYLSHNVNE